MKSRVICFSPTRTSFRVAGAIAEGLGGESVTTDLTLHTPDPIRIESSETAVFAFPVYGGHLPGIAVERLAAIEGNGSPAVVVAVYGNRAYDSALDELAGIVRKQGFRVIAAATFIGEHSYSDSRSPIAAGRPDAEDLAAAVGFGREIAAKLGRNDMTEVDTSAIRKPGQPLFPLIRFIFGVLSLRSGKRPSPKAPTTDPELCTHCGACAANCPVGAIKPGDELNTDASRCIRCCACVKRCPRKARSFDTPFARLLSENFKTAKKPQTLL